MFRMNSNLALRRGLHQLPHTHSGASGAIGTGTITLVTPVSYRVFQRNASNYGDIAITATYTGTPGRVEASWNGGAWSTIQVEPSGGNISGTLTGQSAGQGTLSVRWVGNPDSVVTRTLVGVGDIFIIAGQSNAVGYTPGNQSYSHATLKAGLFGNDYNWKELADPVDDETNQVDSVSLDASHGGSCWPDLATEYLDHMGIPCAFVPCALAGTSITVWQPGANHQDRTTLYGSMVYRALQTGAKVVLWWQGENDAQDGMAEATYNSWLDALANAIYSDLGIKLMPCKLEILNDAPWNFNTAPVNNAINTAWGDNSNVATGPSFTDQDWGGPHYGSTEAPLVGGRWWTAISTAFGW